MSDTAAKTGFPKDLAASEGSHVVQFHEQSPYLVDRVSAFIAPGLNAGEAAIVIATPEHREMIAVPLGTRAIDVAQVRKQGERASRTSPVLADVRLPDRRPRRPRFTHGPPNDGLAHQGASLGAADLARLPSASLFLVLFHDACSSLL